MTREHEVDIRARELIKDWMDFLEFKPGRLDKDEVDLLCAMIADALENIRMYG